MAGKTKSRKRAAESDSSAQNRMLEVVHQILLAGLGAAARARKDGPHVFQELVTEGARVHARTRDSAEGAVREVMGDLQGRLNTGLKQVRGQAEDTLENLEKIFQTRVHRALTQIGVPSAEEVQALSRRVDALNANIDRLARARKAPAPARPRRGVGRAGMRVSA